MVKFRRIGLSSVTEVTAVSHTQCRPTEDSLNPWFQDDGLETASIRALVPASFLYWRRESAPLRDCGKGHVFLQIFYGDVTT